MHPLSRHLVQATSLGAKPFVPYYKLGDELLLEILYLKGAPLPVTLALWVVSGGF